ncbi:MAG: arginine--tRNA ligase [Thermoproteota archaeon]|nr:arginine--tRNA ligase [Thermoproteota archaeon]
MPSINPYAKLREECKIALKDTINRLYPGVSVPPIMLERPPTPEFGELASAVCFEFAKQTATKPRELAEKIVKSVDLSQFLLVRSVEAAGEGYINFYVNFPKFAELTIESVRELDMEYGYVKTINPKKIIVEHTSVNPLHPIHIGQARNPILGDAIARILKARGHTVFRHYYVDDVGRQTAVIAYGYKKLGEPEIEGKPDRFIGKIYTLTSCIVEIQQLKKAIENAKKGLPTTDEISALQKKLDDWMTVAAELKKLFPQLFNQLLNEISKDEYPESMVNKLIRAYETGEEQTKKLIRKVCERCVEGFKETLSRIEIFLDSWDWESDIMWSGSVARVLEKLKETPYVFQVGGILEFDAEKVAQGFKLKKEFGLREDYELPSLTLVRADGTTLYPTRDMAYSLWKLERAEKVINVIGMEQTLSQRQMKLGLYALGCEEAKNLTHFSYNLVTLPGYRMSSRRGRYVTLDNVVDEAIQRAYQEVSKRSPYLNEKEKHKISQLVGIGAVKYALVEVDPAKPVVFTWDRVLDFEKNSAPYIQYSHTRACSILKKADRTPENPNYSLSTHPIECDIVLTLSRFPDIFVDAAENLKPDLIANFANRLADKFNKFYATLPVIKAEPLELSNARLALVDATRIVFRNASKLIGIKAPEKM